MANKHGKDRGITYRRGSWWVRWYQHGRERWEKADSKSQAKVRYGKIRGGLREGRLFDRQPAQEALTLRAWIGRCQEGSANRNRINEVTYARR